MPDLASYEVEQLRRSVAMLPAQSPAGLDREQALQVLEQLERCLVEREHEGQVDPDPF
jgi:hypothetical protein